MAKTQQNPTPHTPGPWTVKTWHYRNPDRDVLTVQTATDAVAQALDLWPPDAREAEKAANAHLIAAAPDLLAALEEGYIYALQTPHTALRIRNQAALGKMRDALAAALGEDCQVTQERCEAEAIVRAEGRG